MKDLSVEQKAKAYDKALERAKEILKDGTISSNAISYIEEIFPELAESEGERIRKEIVRFIQMEVEDEIVGNKWLAWLEKQGGKDKLIKELGEYKVKYTQEVLEKHINSMSNKDDEKLRKATIAFLKDFAEQGYENVVECIDWLEKQGGKNVPYVETSIKDGVYLVYEDKNGKSWCELFTGYNDKENAVGVAFKFGQVSLILYSQNIEDCKITCDDKEPVFGIRSYSVAACDFMGRRRTQDLFERGLSCRNIIPNGWYIPAIGELYVMYLMKNQINEALEYIKQDALENFSYWSSSEHSAGYAWHLDFNYGGFGHSLKTNYSLRVRPVSEFNPLTL